MIEYKLSFNPLKDNINIEEIKGNIISNIKLEDPHLLHQVEMTISELLENAIKYSDNKEIEVLFEYNEHIKILISNYVSKKTHINNIINIIEKIKHIHRNDNLYLKRIEEIIKRDKHGESQMGLYRIFYEGEFNLDYYFDNSNNKISIIATR